MFFEVKRIGVHHEVSSTGSSVSSYPAAETPNSQLMIPASMEEGSVFIVCLGELCAMITISHFLFGSYPSGASLSLFSAKAHSQMKVVFSGRWTSDKLFAANVRGAIFVKPFESCISVSLFSAKAPPHRSVRLSGRLISVSSLIAKAQNQIFSILLPS